ncbi:MAG: DUF5716 family protein [Defluviitaleaceae bacterium]|nr:DUF5716 family protein [Defluviitaleaceae bacterium]
MLKENQFILGIDIGDATSSLAYFDTKKMAPQTLDISGGYGKTTMATALQFIKETKEWVFGDYALQNQSQSNPVLCRLFSSATKPEHWIRYVDEFLRNILSINPRAQLAAIVVSQTGGETKNFKIAFDKYKSITFFVPHSKCIFEYHYFTKKPQNEKLLLLDYGARGLRAGLYTIGKEIKQESRTEEAKVATYLLEASLEEYFASIFVKAQNASYLKKEDMINIKNFVQEHKDQVFLRQKSTKLYMNFCFPPVTCKVAEANVKEMISPLRRTMMEFLKNFFDKQGVDISDIDTVLLVGGGFEMSWSKGVVDELFPDANVVKHKGAMSAMGATIIGAKKLGFIPKDIAKEITIEGFTQLYHDIGVNVKQGKTDVFVPIIERENFSPGRSYNCTVIVADDTRKPFTIDIVKRSPAGDVSLAQTLNIDPIHTPPLTTRLNISIVYTGNYFNVKVVDMGFGELFPSTGFSKEYRIEED